MASDPRPAQRDPGGGWCTDGMWPAATARGTRLTDRPHALQQWFGVDAFITLVPQSYSGRILATAVSSSASLGSHRQLFTCTCIEWSPKGIARSRASPTCSE